MAHDNHHHTYQGRPLPRPDEELVDQGLRFDLDTALNRRRALRFLGVGAAAAGITACGVADPTRANAAGLDTRGSRGNAPDTEIPDETAGPYPGDGSNGPDVLETSGIVRSDIRRSFGGAAGRATGLPMLLDLAVFDLANDGNPFSGVAVYVWQCDRLGRYSMYSSGVADENYLRGVQIADAHGRVRFRSIFPACYPGRWPHIHFEVYPNRSAITDSANAISTSQVALPKNVCERVYARRDYPDSANQLGKLSLSTDNVFGDDSGVHQLATVNGNPRTGYRVYLPVGVDTRTVPSTGNPPGGGPPPGGTPPSS